MRVLFAVVGARPAWPVDWAADLTALDGGKREHLESLGRYLIASAESMVDDLVPALVTLSEG